MLLSILYFFVLTIGLGFLIDLIIKDWRADFLEKLVIRLGTGIAIVPVLGIILNVLHIPLDWKIFLAFSIITFSAALYFRKQELLPKFNFSRLTKSQIYSFLVLIMFAITAYMYIHGSFAYPWFEDGDPYGYALTSKYIAEEKTYSHPYKFDQYSEPYTQGYQIFMGILHQTNNSIYWNMKFFNALIISFSILFFFYFAKRFTKNQDIALISTFALFAVPCWVGHFVFSLNFNMALFPLFLYALASLEFNKKWKFLTAIIFASALVNHASTGVTFVILLIIYYLNKLFVEENINKEVLQAGFFGVLLSLLFFIPSYLKHSDSIAKGGSVGGIDEIFLFVGKIPPLLVYIIIFLALAFLVLCYIKKGKLFLPLKRKDIKYKIFFALFIIIMLLLIIPSNKIIDIKGTGTRDYNLGDFFIAKKGNMTNNPIGVGWVLMTLFCIGILIILLNYKKLFKKENFWVSTTFIWAIFSLVIIFGTYFSIMFIPFRMWTFFAVFASLIIGFSVITILKPIKNNLLKISLLILIVILVIPTSFSQKYWHNTAQWPEHMVMVPESQELYIWLRDNGRVPKDSKVYTLCIHPWALYGYDMNPEVWNDKELAHYGGNPYYRSSLNKTLEDNYNFLKRHNLDYVVLGASCIAKSNVDINQLNKRIQEMINSSNFSLIRNTESEFLFRVI